MQVFNNRFWLLGSFIGLSAGLICLAAYKIDSPFSFIILVFLALPPIIIGNILGLPINAPSKDSTNAFEFLLLNSNGYIWVVLFWTFLGLLIGYIIDKFWN
jgi:predicted cobalt transporter CbtA